MTVDIEDRHTDGPGVVRVVGHRWIEDDLRDPTVGPLPAEQAEQLGGCARRCEDACRPQRDERRVPAPLMGVQARDGTVA